MNEVAKDTSVNSVDFSKVFFVFFSPGPFLMAFPFKFYFIGQSITLIWKLLKLF